MTWKPDNLTPKPDAQSASNTTHTPRSADQLIVHSAERAQTGRPADGGRVIIVANRGPVNFERDAETGALVGEPGAGGVVSGLLAATRGRKVTWIALAMTDADREFAQIYAGKPAPTLQDYPNVALRLVDAPKDIYQRSYDGISNRVLWFTQHYLLQPGVSPVNARAMADWEEGYVAVNELVAHATLTELQLIGERTPVLFQDYHLYLAPSMVRESLPLARLAHFVHIPWPEPRYWELLPETMTHDIFAGLAANDVVGFQTERDAHNFLDGARRFLPDTDLLARPSGDGAASHIPEAGTLLVEGRRMSARAYPIAATPAEVFAQANGHASPETDELLSQARPTPDHKIILRVDRVEPTKNIITGFRAFERLLTEHKRLRERVTFVALLVPSRQGLPEYRAVMRETREIIERINARFSTPNWRPIIALFGNDRGRALAMMREYDALLVNPLIDGMNLVVKEAALVNERAGVVVLSRTAGAYEQIGQYVLGVPPTDVNAIANALYDALTMPRRQRQALATELVGSLMRESAARWLDAQVRDLLAQTNRPRLPVKSGAGAWLASPAREESDDEEPALTLKTRAGGEREERASIS
ncbi:MAG TPA: trehalose-6-phosphate synthase [Ktedonobacterales bacterium]